jgi:hypothetical protein
LLSDLGLFPVLLITVVQYSRELSCFSVKTKRIKTNRESFSVLKTITTVIQPCVQEVIFEVPIAECMKMVGNVVDIYQTT